MLLSCLTCIYDAAAVRVYLIWTLFLDDWNSLWHLIFIQTTSYYIDLILRFVCLFFFLFLFTMKSDCWIFDWWPLINNHRLNTFCFSRHLKNSKFYIWIISVNGHICATHACRDMMHALCNFPLLLSWEHRHMLNNCVWWHIYIYACYLEWSTPACHCIYVEEALPATCMSMRWAMHNPFTSTCMRWAAHSQLASTWYIVAI